jgi:hypothetical protein
VSGRNLIDLSDRSVQISIRSDRLTTLAASERDIKDWFEDYRYELAKLIKKTENIINFDEAGFRAGCMKGHEILVPLDVQEVS